MNRKRITQIFPFLTPLRLYQRQTLYNLKQHYDGNEYSINKSNELPYTLCSTCTDIINKESGYDIKYQYYKEHNLKIIQQSLNGLIIKPNEIFSFIYSTKNTSKIDKFKPGLVVQNGSIKSELGGGICQMSSQLYHLFLQSPLTIVERHSHQTDYFKPNDISDIQGMDATIHYGWKDLKVQNNTSHTFQIKVNIINHQLIVSLLSDQDSSYKYILSNRDIKIKHESNKTLKSFDVIRSIYDIKNQYFYMEELISSDTLEIAYTQ